MLRRSVAGVALICALAMGCAGPGVRSTPNTYLSAQDPVAILRYLERGPDVRATIVGNPTRTDDATFGDAVTTAMNDRDWGPRVNFTARPAHEASPGYRVVMVFGADRTLGAYQLCSIEPPYHTAVPGAGALQAAFCWRDRAISRTAVTVDAIESVDDPRLRAAVRTATRELFPLRRPIEERDHCFPRLLCFDGGLIFNG